MKIETIDPESAAAGFLIARSDEYMSSLYPSASNHLESVRALGQSNVRFLGCYVEGQLIGCGAVKTLCDDVPYGEIKRLFVLEPHRGKGVSKEIMRCLEAYLLETGVTVARLETGVKQPEALGLYRRLGYSERDPFGEYAADPLSVFMEKHLDDDRHEPRP